MTTNLTALQKPKKTNLDLSALGITPKKPEEKRVSPYMRFREAEAAEAEFEAVKAEEEASLLGTLRKPGEFIISLGKLAVEEVQKAPLARFIKSIKKEEPLIESFKQLLPKDEEIITFKNPERLAMQVFDVMPIGMAKRAKKAAQTAKKVWEAQQVAKKARVVPKKLPIPKKPPIVPKRPVDTIALKPVVPIKPPVKPIVPEVVPKIIPKISKELQPLAKEARKFKSVDRFVKAFEADIKVPIIDGKIFIKAVYPDELIQGKGITKDILLKKIQQSSKELKKMIESARKVGIKKEKIEKLDLEKITIVSPSEEGLSFYQHLINTGFLKHIGTKEDRFVYKITDKLKKYKPVNKLADFYNQATKKIPITERKPLKEIIEKPVIVPERPPKPIPAIPKELVAEPSIDVKRNSLKTSLQKDIAQETKLSQEADKITEPKDITKTVKDSIEPIIKPLEEDLITTRKFKQTNEWKDFAKYAENNIQLKDIKPPILFRHATLTMERVAEYLDGKLGGRVYKEIVKPVYDSAEKMTIEGNKIKGEIDSFGILEGSKIDRDASLFAQKKIKDTTQKAKDIAKYTRDKYDEFLERLNKTRAKLGVEPIKKRKDYITHINELNTLSELFGGLERVSVKAHISKLKSELLDMHPNWTDARAFDSAKRKVEGLTGVAQYVDARQPAFKFAKQRLSEYEADPSIMRSFSAYMPSALRYIHQAENVARNKAFKDVLPANAKEFTRLWNTEQVAGRQPPSFLSPVTKRVVMAIRGTLGANTILGNMATTMMQLTSFPQVFAMAGVRNTFYGIGKRLRSYIPEQHTLFETSRTRALRNLDIDIGLGDSLIDQALIKMGKFEKVRDISARTRQGIDLGRRFLRMIMETADQFTVGASYEAFYRKGVLDGLTPSDTMEFAEIMTGKTQASYFKEALPPFLNTTEGKTIGQFGTYTMNQWEMFKRDFGKELNLNEKSKRSVKEFFKQFIVFLSAAYIVDSISEKTFGRQPYDIKELVDDSVGFAKGEVTGKQLIDTSKETVMSYVPFMGSVKFKSMPPVFEFGSDTLNAIFGTGKGQEKAIGNLENKWIYNILFPYAGNQTRKSLQGIEATTDVELPFVKNISKDIDIQTNLDKAKSIVFGPYASQEAQTYFENRERRERLKEKHEITGNITSDENIAKLKKMSDDEFEIYTAQYVDRTLKTINRKMEKDVTGLEAIFEKKKGKSLQQIFK